MTERCNKTLQIHVTYKTCRCSKNERTLGPIIYIAPFPPRSDPPATSRSFAHSTRISQSHWHSNTVDTINFTNWAKTKGASLIPLKQPQTDNPFLFRCDHFAILIQTTKTVCYLSLHAQLKKIKRKKKRFFFFFYTTEGRVCIPTVNIVKQRHIYDY